MFSRCRNGAMVVVLLASLAAVAPSYPPFGATAEARSCVTPVTKPGDPDEFETTVSTRGLGVDKPSMSADTSARGAGRVAREARTVAGNGGGESVLTRWKAICRRVASYVSRVVMELDMK